MKSLLPIFVFSLLPSLATATEFGNISVTQIDSGNTATSVTLTKAAGSTPNFSILSGNRGDYDVSFGTANDVTGGVMLSSISQNGRDNTAAGDTIGLFYATSATDHVGSGFSNKYWVPVFRTAVGDEVNINVACAWFPYSQWLGGFVRNSAATNGGANNTLTASAGINLGTQFVDGTGGVSTINLTSLSASSASGVLLVNHAKNEDNYALSRANADGTFTVWVHDNGANGASYEQDPVAFVYIPTADVGTKQLVATARVNSDASTAVSGGTFTLTKGGTGQWYLTIPGHNNTTGVLIISPEGGGTNTSDNVLSYQWDVANSRWVIESRDLSGAVNQPTLQDGASAGEDVFSFAFLATTNQGPTVAISAPAASGFTAPAAFTIEADATDSDGTITQVEFLRNGVVIATDTDSPFTLSQSALPTGSYSYIARATDNLGATGLSPAKVITVTFDPNNIPSNTALSFDGVNDYVTMGAAPELNVGGPVGNGLTLECWFRKEGTGLTAGSGSGGVTAVPLFGKGRGEGDGSNIDCNIFFGITAGGILVGDFESQATGLNHPIIATNAPIVNGTWYHAAVTYDGATSTWKMYLNGSQVGTASASIAGSVPRFDSIQHFGIGTAMNSTGVTEGAFAGVIDEARVWNRALSATEIANGKDLELASGSGLIGRFGLNEGSGTGTASTSGISVGTLTNGPVWVEGAPFSTTNISPVVSLTAPVNNASSFMPFPVTFTADATDADGIAKVEFRVNGIKVGEDTSAPFSYAWTPPAIGTYAVSARAVDIFGAGSASAAASLLIETNPNQPPVITLASPSNGASVTGTSVTLNANLADSTGDAMTVTFYGRQTTPVTPGPDFSIVAIPDTQYYSEGSSGRANTVTVEQLVGTFSAQTQWVVDNKATRNIAFVSHMGDIVESGNFGGNPIQWQRASAAMGNLEKPLTTLRAYGIPYGIAPGNHDIDPIGNYDTGSTTFYNQYFGINRFAGRDYRGGNYGSDNTNSYQLFSASGLDFIAINLAYDTTQNQAILDWADALLKAHPHRRAIISSHYIIGQGNPASFGAQGSAIYNGLKDNPNLFLLLCGHIHAEGRRTDVFEGRTVYSVLSDYQGLINGGNGFLRTLTFSPANNRIRVESWSPTLNRAASLSDGLPHFDGTYDLNYNLQSPVNDWVPLGTVNVPANGTTASLDWTGLEKGKNFEWYVAANDSVNTVSSTSSGFSTAPGIAPTVTLDSPLAAATFSSPATIALTATAADSDGSVSRVEFYQGGTKIGQDTDAPYEFTWSGVGVGTYDLSAIVVDDSNLTSVSNGATVIVNPGDFLPVVSLTAPTSGTVLEAPANLTLAADATDNEAPVAKVEFFSGTLSPVLLGEDTDAPFTLDLTNLGAGAYSFTARATDSIGQTTTSAPVTVAIFTEAAAPNVTRASVGTFAPPAWTIANTGPSPYQFNLPGADLGDVEIKINGASVPFNSGIALATNWAGNPPSASSNDNICQPYANASGNVFVSVQDNSNNNASNANPTTSEQSSEVGVAFLAYADGFTGASINSSAGIIAGNLPAGVTVTKSGGAGTYTVNGLSVAGNMLAFTNGDSGTLVDNVCSVRIVNSQWVIDTRDNAGGTQDNEFSFVYLPPATTGVFAGKVSSTGVVSSTNTSATTLGVSATVGANGVDLTFGDGSVINPTTAAIFVTADATNGAAGSAAVDNLIAWSASGNSFRVFTQDLPEINGTHEAIDLRFLVNPFAPIIPIVPPTVTIAATDAAAGEFGADQALEFTVTRTGSTTAALTVPLTANGNASAADYSGFASSVIIPISQASVSLPLTVVADTDAEGPETVTISLAASADFTAGSPASANAVITDKPSQSFYFDNIADAAKRNPTMDADGDGKANIIEYFMGTLPADAGSNGVLTIPSLAVNTFKVRYPRAKNRPDVTGSLRWSSDLVNWHTSGQSNGTHTVTFAEAVVSATEVNPETVEATATITGPGEAKQIFVRLSVE